MKYLTWILLKAAPIVSMVKRINRPKPASAEFFDLAPVSNADSDGLYRQALRFAMQNPAVRNIALTGPYGSGKTSVINTFERTSEYRFLNISLATFSDPDNRDKESASADSEDSEENTVRIERSIIQQMLYGAESNALPYSRFKRISKPRSIELNALFFVAWLLGCGYVYRNRDDFPTTFSIQDINWLWITTAVFACLYTSLLVSKLIRASHSLTIKRLSLQNGEIELDRVPESSILNKHLDEIIYFFDERKYDVVVFEDLDRFKNTEIFIKLREINKILNDCRKHRKSAFIRRPLAPIKFIYAIKDDVFSNTDRSKFFDFIVPVIPIINNSNSREMLAQCINPAGSIKHIEGRFLSEVSLYIDDLRLIKNISNEYAIYQSKVGGVPNLEKLLAIIIYKNLYPRDFEELHHGKGALFAIVEKRKEAIAKAAAEADMAISNLKSAIRGSEDELCRNQSELAKIFLGQLCISASAEGGFLGVYASDVLISLDELMQEEQFRRLYPEKNLCVQTRIMWNHQPQNKRYQTGLSFREIEEKAIPGFTFEEKYERLKNKEVQRRQHINHEIEKIKEHKSELSRKPLREIFKHAGFDAEQFIRDSGIKDSRLLTYLIRNGYLDETYHLYISIFHEGRLSRNDWSYIQAIRDFQSVEPLAQIDNPEEVANEMRAEDFGAEHVLNVALIDYLMEDLCRNQERIASAVSYISKRFALTQAFFESYWLAGKRVATFTATISAYWPDYAVSATNTDKAETHIANIIAHVPPEFIADEMNTGSLLSDYLGSHAGLVFSENIIFQKGYHALLLMEVTIEDLPGASLPETLLDYVHENSLYSININNLNFILSKYATLRTITSTPGVTLQNAHYSTVKNSGSGALKKHVLRNINIYLSNVSFALEGNNLETEDAIIEILNNPDVDQELAIDFVLRQLHKFESFKGIPISIWSELLFNSKIILTWPNLMDYLASPGVDVDGLNNMLTNLETCELLASSSIPKHGRDKRESTEIIKFIVNNRTIELLNYKVLCSALPDPLDDFPPALSEEKKIVLADIGKVALTEASFATASDSSKLLATIVKRNFAKYRENTETFDLNSDTVACLLSMGLSDDDARYLIRRLGFDDLQASPRATAVVSQQLASLDLDDNHYNAEIISYCLRMTEDPDVSLGIVLRFASLLSDDEIRDALRKCKEPYSSLLIANKRPKIENNERNLNLIKELASRKLISSFNREASHIRVNTFRKSLFSNPGGIN